MKGIMHLDARGKGDFSYDYFNDVLFFKVKNREYDRSIEIENFVVDVDKKGFIVGMQIFEASEFFRVPKVALRGVAKWKLSSKVYRGRIEIRLAFQTVLRNKILEHAPIVLEQLPEKEHIKSSEMVMTNR